ncbi:MAG: Rieske (2Fe-2S) protein [Deltaproteobacteria bacterium]|nr:Rieske (2Fe-2S) protein [Deltaproteobacteria bacterium]
MGASYGLGGAYAVRFLFPRKREKRTVDLFVTMKSELIEGKSLQYALPSGKQILIQKLADQFLALSNICPHLGCKVRFERFENGDFGFLCPCHFGKFDLKGKAFAGPPAQAGQSLEKFEVVVKGEAVFVRVAVS